MSFHFCVKVTNAPRVANSSNLSELKYSEVQSACISTVTINRRARLKEPIISSHRVITEWGS